MFTMQHSGFISVIALLCSAIIIKVKRIVTGTNIRSYSSRQKVGERLKGPTF